MESLLEEARDGSSAEVRDGVHTTKRRVCNQSSGICSVLKACVATGVVTSLDWHTAGVIASYNRCVVVIGLVPSRKEFEAIVFAAKTRLRSYDWRLFSLLCPPEEDTGQRPVCYRNPKGIRGHVALFVIMRDVVHPLLAKPMHAQDVCYFLSGGGERHRWENPFQAGDWFIWSYSPSQLGRWIHRRWTELSQGNIIVLDTEGLEFIKRPRSLVTKEVELPWRWKSLVAWRQCSVCEGIDGGDRGSSSAKCETCLWRRLLVTLWDYNPVNLCFSDVEEVLGGLPTPCSTGPMRVTQV